jgi:hypothetical protein
MNLQKTAFRLRKQFFCGINVLVEYFCLSSLQVVQGDLGGCRKLAEKGRATANS